MIMEMTMDKTIDGFNEEWARWFTADCACIMQA
jgi:hypothetical protein